MPPGEEPLLDALERWLRSTTGVVVPREAWDWSKVARAPAADLPRRRRQRRRAGARQGPRGAQGAAAAAVRAGDGRGRRRQRAGPHRRDDVGVRDASRSPFTLTRAGHEVRGVPGAGRRGRDRRARGSSAPTDEARGPAPARRAPAAAARAARARRRGAARRPDQRGEARAGRVAVPHRRRAARGLPRRRGAATSSTRARRCATRRRTTRCSAAAAPRSTDGAPRRCWPTCSGCSTAGGAPTRLLSGRAEWRMLPALTDMKAPARPAGAPRLRRRGRRRPSCAATRRTSRALDAAARRARRGRRRGQPRPAADGPDRRPAGGLPPPGRRRCPRAGRRASGCGGCAGCSRSTASRCGPSSSARRTRSATSGSARRYALARSLTSVTEPTAPPPDAARDADFFDGMVGGTDPALVSEAADRAATLLVRGARETDDAEVADRLLHLADTEGIETIAEVWSGSPADSLAGCLWRLYLLRSWVYADPVGVAREFEAGRARGPGRAGRRRRRRPARARRAARRWSTRCCAASRAATSPTCCSGPPRSPAWSPPAGPALPDADRRRRSRGCSALAEQLEAAGHVELDHGLA